MARSKPTCRIGGCGRRRPHRRGLCEPHHKFFRHKTSAARRGIQFCLSFDDWWDTWERSGHWHERGRGRGQYVMSRPGDQGAYEVGNVRIITCKENSREGTLGYRHTPETRKRLSAMARGEYNTSAKLTSAKVLEIRAMEGEASQRQIARQFGISQRHVRNILKRKKWPWLRPPRVRLVEKPRLEWSTPVVKLYRVFLNKAARERLKEAA